MGENEHVDLWGQRARWEWSDCGRALKGEGAGFAERLIEECGAGGDRELGTVPEHMHRPSLVVGSQEVVGMSAC